MTSGNLGSEPLIPTDFTFAYRFYEAETQQPWPETNAIDPPRPPNDGWRRKKGPETPWREWKVGRNLTEGEVIPRRAYSIVWRKSQQAYWILPANCVSWQEQSANPAEGWHRLQFHNLAEDTPRRRGLWKVVEYGLRMEHGSICPPDFKEFLPGHFFSDNGSPTPCHLVGDLSLVLGMLAMVPRSPLLIVRQIDKYFYYENSPRYIPTTKHKQWYPMSRDEDPDRALVMQTGIIKNEEGSKNMKVLEQWEDGLRGPMVSSHEPTAAEMLNWTSSGGSQSP